MISSVVWLRTNEMAPFFIWFWNIKCEMFPLPLPSSFPTDSSVHSRAVMGAKLALAHAAAGPELP